MHAGKMNLYAGKQTSAACMMYSLQSVGAAGAVSWNQLY